MIFQDRLSHIEPNIHSLLRNNLYNYRSVGYEKTTYVQMQPSNGDELPNITSDKIDYEKQTV